MRELKKILAIYNNIVNIIEKKKKYNINKIIYFNYNKKGHYASYYIKSNN